MDTIYPNGVEISKDVEELLTRMAAKRAITFDEITLSDRPVEFHPNDVALRSFVTRNVSLKGCGIMSAAMDTVTERDTALAMAKMGGIGVIHRYLPPQEQADQVRWVRRRIHYGGMIDQPVTFLDTDHYSSFQRKCATNKWGFTSFPVVDQSGKFVGLVTTEVLAFVDTNTNPQLKDVMLPLEKITVASHSTDTEEAFQIMRKHKVKRLPVVDQEGALAGMYVWNDVNSDQRKRQKFSLDRDGHFLVAAAIGTDETEIERAKLLVEAGCCIIVIDGSSAQLQGVKRMVSQLRQLFQSKIDIIAGNISSYKSAVYLLSGEHKPDALKVGIGGGATSSARQEHGHGIPQVTALFEVWRATRDIGAQTKYYIPIISDGGVRTSGDIVKALAVGASSVMIGSLMAGTKEAPGVVIEKNGRKFKSVRGMSSRRAMATQQQDGQPPAKKQAVDSPVVFGVQGRVLLSGSVEQLMTQLLGGVQSGLAHTGAKTVPEFQARANVWIQSFAGVAEGRPHDIADIQN
eukprot:CAMPEP_0175171994 /NCGR_PEP_ID=MMETSP0087-20121206/31160_1 /TAXON_ID=136419 /ORGANISM="Unknown Unknown, Strain D1" /LENGTH=516 /DNA_ID=CAMNT_0016462963 /DNA_START=42 /DNA_END=1592 /DNA_ORIENTATION=+